MGSAFLFLTDAIGDMTVPMAAMSKIALPQPGLLHLSQKFVLPTSSDVTTASAFLCLTNATGVTIARMVVMNRTAVHQVLVNQTNSVVTMDNVSRQAADVTDLRSVLMVLMNLIVLITRSDVQAGSLLAQPGNVYRLTSSVTVYRNVPKGTMKPVVRRPL